MRAGRPGLLSGCLEPFRGGLGPSFSPGNEGEPLGFYFCREHQGGPGAQDLEEGRRSAGPLSRQGHRCFWGLPAAGLGRPENSHYLKAFAAVTAPGRPRARKPS